MPNEKFFAVRNLLIEHEEVPYVVLRNWVTIGSQMVEVLVNNRDEFVKKLGLKKDRSAAEEYRTIYKWRSGIKSFQFNVKTVKDSYYHPDLGERVLKGREKDEELDIYIVSKRDQFVEVLYNSIYRMGKFSADDQVKLAKFRPLEYEAQVTDIPYGHKFLCNLGYFPTKCADQSVELHVP